MMRGNRKLYLKKSSQNDIQRIESSYNHIFLWGGGMISELKNINFSEFNEG